MHVYNKEMRVNISAVSTYNKEKVSKLRPVCTAEYYLDYACNVRIFGKLLLYSCHPCL